MAQGQRKAHNRGTDQDKGERWLHKSHEPEEDGGNGITKHPIHAAHGDCASHVEMIAFLWTLPGRPALLGRGKPTGTIGDSRSVDQV